MEAVLEIIGAEAADGVHTIEMWYSRRQGRWIVERRDRDGDMVGQVFRAADESEADTCVADWLRAHSETHLVGRDRGQAEAPADRRAA